MKHFHIKIHFSSEVEKYKTDLSAHFAYEIDLTQEQVINLLSRFRRGLWLQVGGRTIQSQELRNIEIRNTEFKGQDAIPSFQRSHEKALQDKRQAIHALDLNWQLTDEDKFFDAARSVFDRGEDCTRSFIQPFAGDTESFVNNALASDEETTIVTESNHHKGNSSIRFALIAHIYKQSRASIKCYFHWKEIASELSKSDYEVATAVILLLKQQRLTESGPMVAITSNGIDYYEDKMNESEIAGKQSVSYTTNIGEMNNSALMQNSNNSSQMLNIATFGESASTLLEAIKKFQEILPNLELSEAEQESAEVTVEELKTEVEKPQPNPKLVRVYGKRVVDLLSGLAMNTAGNVLAAPVIANLHHLVSVFPTG